MTAPFSNEELFDLVVIGGGINGAAIARDASLRKLKVVLLEKEDFGSGASSKTSKLAHGGVRYLEQFQFGLVRECLRERSLLLKNAPHLVKPLPFLLPVYAEDPHSLWKINLGLYLYDYLAGKTDFPRHQKLSPENILKEIPGLKSSGLKGGCSFYDAQMLDNRIVIENILSAEHAGAKVYNHTEVTDLIREQGQIIGVVFFNSLTGEKGKFFGKAIVNASGAWSGKIGEMEPGIVHCTPAPTKGVHLIVPRMISNTALLLRAPQDGRVFFVLPWGEYNLIGTTDTFYDGNPDHLTVTTEDRNYLLEAFNAYFPDKPLEDSSVISSFAGLRPLVAPEREKFASDIVREHVIQVSTGGLITVLGGKYTTHRLVAENVVDVVMRRLKCFAPCTTKNTPLPGASGPYSLDEVKEKLKTAGLDVILMNHLLNTYGTVSLNILEIMRSDGKESEVVCSGHPHVFAEITYGVKVEHVKTPEDWFLRRTTMICPFGSKNECIERVTRKLSTLL
jgi:glycerol-3-phosphate dehydrogenase